VIRVTNLSKTYRQGRREVVAVDGVDLHVRAGEVFGVLGRSGAGKSTLARCLNLLERPTTGTVEVGGEDLTALSPAALRRARQRVGVVFQHVNLLSSRTAAQNVAFPLEVAGLGRRQRAERVAELLDLVGIADRAGAYPAQLSGGQRQRVGIARALAAAPNVLLCDEATSALDPETTDSILDLLRDLNRRLDLTILLITHEMGVVRALCDRVAVMEAGRIVEQGPVAELAARPDSLLARQLFPAPTLTGDRAERVTLIFGERATELPVLATLARTFELELNVVGGSIQTLGGQRLGRLDLELPAPLDDAARRYLAESDVTVVDGEGDLSTVDGTPVGVAR